MYIILFIKWSLNNATKKRSDSKNAEVLCISRTSSSLSPAQMHPPIPVTSLHHEHYDRRARAIRYVTWSVQQPLEPESFVFLFLPCSSVSQVHSRVQTRRASFQMSYCCRGFWLLRKLIFLPAKFESVWFRASIRMKRAEESREIRLVTKFWILFIST